MLIVAIYLNYLQLTISHQRLKIDKEVETELKSRRNLG